MCKSTVEAKEKLKEWQLYDAIVRHGVKSSFFKIISIFEARIRLFDSDSQRKLKLRPKICVTEMAREGISGEVAKSFSVLLSAANCSHSSQKIEFVLLLYFGFFI